MKTDNLNIKQNKQDFIELLWTVLTCAFFYIAFCYDINVMIWVVYIGLILSYCAIYNEVYRKYNYRPAPYRIEPINECHSG